MRSGSLRLKPSDPPRAAAGDEKVRHVLRRADVPSFHGAVRTAPSPDRRAHDIVALPYEPLVTRIGEIR
ncbi:hypothetical protein TNCT6_58950 [Streptomyces sp. 6-11-2]|nr:hypothetical protein TNCT6_58950 [Streptomyces sp. 6-11-2]